MQIRDLMTSDVRLISPSETIGAAAALMREQGFGVLPVARHNRLVGVLTDRDIVVRSTARGQDPSAGTVKDVMSVGVLYCFDDQEAEEVAANMGKQQVRRMPVLDREKRLVGIVSLGDLSTNGIHRAVAKALKQICDKGS